MVLTSCLKKEESTGALARVGDQYLYEEDLKEILPADLSKEDSILFVKDFINKWAQHKLLLEKALLNLKEDQQEIDALVAQYHEDLLINKYKEAVVEQDLDTVITEDDIEKFYGQNKDIFKLNEELVKFRYLYFGKDILNPKEFIKLFRSDNYESDTLLMKNGLQFKSFNLNDSIWVRYEELLAKAPFFRGIDKDRLLKKNNSFQNEDSTGIYLVDIKDVLLRNETAPESYAKETIKQMILHKRKLELIKKVEKTITEDAIENREFQTY
ncbi:MAG: peptidyl-prolyl cis-trans isomerase [Flavobacteriaceae bacterium]|nr:peptidyl-prolyl cis-trans isomerase [Flavobacteriaceae bacterium]